jgi:hypothetical protein
VLAYSQAHKRSYRDDCSRVKPLKEWFGTREAESLLGPEMEKILAGALKGKRNRERVQPSEKWAASTFNHYRSLLILCFREALRVRKVTSNPAREIRHRREDNSRSDTYLVRKWGIRPACKSQFARIVPNI